MDQVDISVKTVLNVFPVKLNSTSSDPEENDSGQD